MRTLVAIGAYALGFVGVAWAQTRPSQIAQLSVADLVKRSTDSVVQIAIFDESGKEVSLGSGFFVSPDGEIVTNFHVIEGAHSALAKLANGSFFPIEGILASDPDTDLALIKVSGKELPFLTFGTSETMRVGDHVVAIGSPLGLEGTVSDGIISGLRQEDAKTKWLQTTAPVSHGNSGGPLLDMTGRVVGVITWGVDVRKGQNLNFAIPSQSVKPLLAGTQQLMPLTSAVRKSSEAEASSPSSQRTEAEETPASHEGSGPNAAERHAIDQLSMIANSIKGCRSDLPIPNDPLVADGFEDVFGPPINVVWDVEPHASVRSRFLGYIEFSDPSYLKPPPEESLCNYPHADKKECRRRWVIAMRIYNQQVNHPRQFHYEFNVTAQGLEFIRAYKKTQQTDGEDWVPGSVDSDGCASRAIRDILGAGAHN